MAVNVKICGIKTPQFIDICAKAGADFIGFVSFAKSPRHVELSNIKTLVDYAKNKINSVVLTVNPNEAMIQEIAAIKPDYIQLHGHESVDICRYIKATSNLKIIKAISIASAEDVSAAHAYEGLVDILLFDTKPIAGAELPGGNGQMFDWSLVVNDRFNCQTMLAGGLDHNNVSKAVELSGINAVDISSKVEMIRGIKDVKLVKQFIRQAKAIK